MVFAYKLYWLIHFQNTANETEKRKELARPTCYCYCSTDKRVRCIFTRMYAEVHSEINFWLFSINNYTLQKLRSHMQCEKQYLSKLVMETSKFRSTGFEVNTK